MLYIGSFIMSGNAKDAKGNGSLSGLSQKYELNSVFDATHASKYPRTRPEQLQMLLWYG